jgi:hypothetical protein
MFMEFSDQTIQFLRSVVLEIAIRNFGSESLF